MLGIVNTGAKTVPEAPESNENVPCGFCNGVMRKVFRNSFEDAVAGERRPRANGCFTRRPDSPGAEM